MRNRIALSIAGLAVAAIAATAAGTAGTGTNGTAPGSFEWGKAAPAPVVIMHIPAAR
jgi:hypothetical protein